MIQLSTMEPRTPQQIFVRLTECEKLDLRGASESRIEHLAYSSYQSETGKNPAILAEVQRLCLEQLRAFDAMDIAVSNFGRIPSTWKF